MLKKLMLVSFVLLLGVSVTARADELILDPSMEIGWDWGWTKGETPSGAANIECWANHTGNSGMAMRNWVDSGTGFAYQDVPVTGSTTYNYTLWSLRDAGDLTGDFYMNVEWYAGGSKIGEMGKTTIPVPSDDWVQQTLNPTSPAGSDTARVIFGSDTVNLTGKFDDVDFSGLLANPSFEDRWTMSGVAGYEGWAAHTGSRGIAVRTWAGSEGEAHYDNVSVTGGESYLYTLWGLSDDVITQGSYYMKVEWYDGENLLGESVKDISDGLTNADWTQFSFNVTAMAGSDSARVMFGGTGVNVVGKFDDASFVEVPEPATVFILGLGGLFLSRRKR